MLRAGCLDGSPPNALIQATDDNLYGTTRFSPNSYGGGGTVFRITLTGSLTTLYSFCSQSNCTDGNEPMGGLTQASDSNLYGTTAYGGTNGSIWGTAFKITLGGVITNL